MKLYVVMIDDRHCDPEPEVFATAEQAVAFARHMARLWAGEDALEEQEVEGWLYCAQWSTEGDSIWVVERELRTS